jgi:hypothetical protein
MESMLWLVCQIMLMLMMSHSGTYLLLCVLCLLSLAACRQHSSIQA